MGSLGFRKLEVLGLAFRDFRVLGLSALRKQSTDDSNEKDAWIHSQNMGYTNYQAGWLSSAAAGPTNSTEGFKVFSAKGFSRIGLLGYGDLRVRAFQGVAVLRLRFLGFYGC